MCPQHLGDHVAKWMKEETKASESPEIQIPRMACNGPMGNPWRNCLIYTNMLTSPPIQWVGSSVPGFFWKLHMIQWGRSRISQSNENSMSKAGPVEGG